MKKTISLLAFFFICLINQKIFSQSGAIPSLLIQPSPLLSAMGQTGVALTSDDPFEFLWNPAQVAQSNHSSNLSFIFYPEKIDW